MCVFSRLFAFQKLSEKGVNGRRRELHSDREAAFNGVVNKGPDKPSRWGGGSPFSLQNADDGRLLSSFFWRGPAASCPPPLRNIRTGEVGRA